MIYFQYKTIYRTIGTKKLLYQIGKSQNDLCRLCGLEIETISHLLVICTKTKSLWQNLNEWIHLKINKKLALTPLEIIMGHLNRDNDFLPINTILLVTKYHIFASAVKVNTLSIEELKWKLKQCYQEQYLLSCETNKESVFKDNWKNFNVLFEV